jgi:transposase-like protein
MVQIAWPTTLIDAVRYFSDADRALKLLVAIRWPHGVACPTCGSQKVSFLNTRRLWKCGRKHDRRQFSIKVGSIFEDSPLPLDKWLVAMWLIVNCKNGVSSYEIARDLSVTQQTAWFMLHRIRKAMQSGSFEKMGGAGPVEVDETFIGGLARNMHRAKKAEKIHGTGGAGKDPVVGLLDRETGQVRVTHVQNRRKKTLQAHVREKSAAARNSIPMNSHPTPDSIRNMFMSL